MKSGNTAARRLLAGAALSIGILGAGGAWGQDAMQPAAIASPAHQPTSELVVFLAPGTDPAVFAAQHGMILKYTFVSDPNIHVFDVGTVPAAQLMQNQVRADLRALAVYRNQKTKFILYFEPNDPYFPRNNPVGFPGQWHLRNEVNPGRDARVWEAWRRDLTGIGVVIGIVDDCLQWRHEDLSGNYATAPLSHNFGPTGGADDPSPVYGVFTLPDGSVYPGDMHGTSVAGVAAARGGNAIGGTGAAPLASLAGLRIAFPYIYQTEVMFADATLHQTAAIAIKNHSYGIPVAYQDNSLARAALVTSAAGNTVNCFAAGNERGREGFYQGIPYFYDSDSNKKQLQSSPDVITVAAFGSDGRYASYSSYGACVFVTSPSSSSTGNGITTTDLQASTAPAPPTGGYNYNTTTDGDPFPNLNYTSTFGGTSSATPLVSGVMALVKQAQPALNVRMAKHLLAHTCDVVDPNDGSAQGDGNGTTGSAWKTNAAGFRFNQNYGFGLINADKLTAAAPSFTGVASTPPSTTGTISMGNVAIPDGSSTGISSTFTLTGADPLEEMLVTLTVNHNHWGQLEAYLTSPSGTRSRLMRSNGNIDYYGILSGTLTWTFCSNAFWGESPAGTWTIQLTDRFGGSTGTWTSYAVEARMGSLTGGVAPAKPGGLTVRQVPTGWELSWTPNTEPILAGYNVYKNASKLNATIVPTTTYVDTSDPTWCVPADYYVVALNWSLTPSVASDTVHVPLPLSTPANLTAVRVAGGIQLDWDDNPELNIAGYDIYRSPGGAGTFTQIASGVTLSEYLDTIDPSGCANYDYYVIARNTCTVSSAPSLTVNYAPPTTILSATGLVTNVVTGGISLSWTASTSPGTIVYDVFRSTTSGGPYSQVASGVIGTTYTDHSIPPWSTTAFYYVVQAMDTCNMKSGNSVEGIAPPPSPPPTGVTAEGLFAAIRVTWTVDSPMPPTLAGYAVAISTDPAGPFTRVNATPVTSGEYYISSGLQGGPCYIVVQKVNLATQLSGDSAPAVATPVLEGGHGGRCFATVPPGGGGGIGMLAIAGLLLSCIAWRRRRTSRPRRT